MKIRNGFVSNSSSSSFIFGLPKGRGCVYGFPCNIKSDAEPFDPERHVFGGDDYYERRYAPGGPKYALMEEDYDGENVAEMIKANPDFEFFIVEYEDHTSYEAEMEHGDHWYYVPHVRISHH